MSLAVWLPLNGDLHNQGLMPITFSTTTVNWNAAGKIGQAFSTLNSNVIGTCPNLNGVTTFSLTFWCFPKTNSSITTNWCNVIALGSKSADNSTSAEFRFESSYGNTYILSHHNNVGEPIGGGTGSLVSERDKWYHVAVVANNESHTIKYYVNGVQLTTSSFLKTHNGGHLDGTIKLANENIDPDCLLNDVRIYDHALSVKEVEEIAKGLVLHYKLDNNGLGNPNLLPVSGSNIINSTESFEFQGWAGNFYTKTWMNENLTPGKQYTLSYTVTCLSIPESPYVYKENRASPILVHQGGGWSQVTTTSDGIKTTNMVVGESRTYKCTFTFATATETYEYYGLCGYTALYRNENNQRQYAKFRIDGLKLEEGDSATRWSPAPADLGLDTSIVYDCSGYKNNGVITGNISMSSDSIRYEVSTNFSSGSYIRVEKRPTAYLPKDAITVNLWVNTTTWYTPISCTEGGGWNFENNSGIRFPVYISGIGYKIAQSSITTSSLNNAWHMLTGTMDKNNIKIYIDGEEIGTVANGSSNGIGYANNYLFINAEAGGDSTTPASASRVGKTSDVRIYATALTAAQIKELYETSMSIDNKGNIHTRELVEI